MDSKLADALEAFHERVRGENTPLVINDLVEVVIGKNTGLQGLVVSLESIEPVRVYKLARNDGQGYQVENWQNLKLVRESSLPMRSCPALVAFEQAARAFVDLAGDSDNTETLSIERLYRAVLRLASSATVLGQTQIGSQATHVQDELGLEVELNEWQAVFDKTGALFFDTFYDYVWPDGDKTLGDIADDVADIYRDLKPGLDAWDLENGEYIPGALWSWELMYECHWIRHLEGLLGALPEFVNKPG